jgi:hypothetical protein
MCGKRKSWCWQEMIECKSHAYCYKHERREHAATTPTLTSAILDRKSAMASLYVVAAHSVLHALNLSSPDICR